MTDQQMVKRITELIAENADEEKWHMEKMCHLVYRLHLAIKKSRSYQNDDIVRGRIKRLVLE